MTDAPRWGLERWDCVDFTVKPSPIDLNLIVGVNNFLTVSPSAGMLDGPGCWDLTLTQEGFCHLPLLLEAIKGRPLAFHFLDQPRPCTPKTRGQTPAAPH